LKGGTWSRFGCAPGATRSAGSPAPARRDVAWRSRFAPESPSIQREALRVPRLGTCGWSGSEIASRACALGPILGDVAPGAAPALAQGRSLDLVAETPAADDSDSEKVKASRRPATSFATVREGAGRPRAKAQVPGLMPAGRRAERAARERARAPHGISDRSPVGGFGALGRLALDRLALRVFARHPAGLAAAGALAGGELEARPALAALPGEPRTAR
jgi:hypothetical protein